MALGTNIKYKFLCETIKRYLKIRTCGFKICRSEIMSVSPSGVPFKYCGVNSTPWSCGKYIPRDLLCAPIK